MNGNRSNSYAQMRTGSMSGPNFDDFKQNSGSAGIPQAHQMTGFQKETQQSGSFVFKTGELAPGKIQSYSKSTRGSVYGAGDSSTANPSNPGGN